MTNAPPQSEVLSKALHTARRQLGWAIRDLVEQVEVLNGRDSVLYGTTNRTTISRIETQGDEFVLEQPARVIRAIVTALYGSPEAMWHDTGLDLHLSSSHPTTRKIPLWTEGALVTAVDVTLGGNDWVECCDSASMFAVRVQGNELTPKLFEGQVVNINPHLPVQAGALVALRRHGKLKLAFALGGGSFTTIHGEPFKARAEQPDIVILGRASEHLLDIPYMQIAQSNMQATA